MPVSKNGIEKSTSRARSLFSLSEVTHLKLKFTVFILLIPKKFTYQLCLLPDPELNRSSLSPEFLEFNILTISISLLFLFPISHPSLYKVYS